MTELGLDAQWVLPRGVAGGDLRTFVQHASSSGIGHLGLGDHVTFRGGEGFDGLVNAMALLASDEAVRVRLQVYMLPLRHPLPVARQLATIAEQAPGRLDFAVGIGGEDRDEYWACGVDPATRGARADESLSIIRRLLSGESVTHEGVHFQVSGARLLPVPASPIPLIVGGRSAAAFRRAGRLGDGWQGTWVSVERYREAVETIDKEAAAAARTGVDWNHGMTIWAGFDHDGVSGRDRVARVMEGFYKLPFEKFSRYVPTGSPAEIADQVRPFAEAGCRAITLVAGGLDPMVAVDQAAAVAAELSAD